MLILNIAKGLFWQVVGLLATFVSIPISINYLGKFDYGVWVTVFGIALWLSGLDLGIGNGFRNKLAIAFAQKRLHRAKIIISNAYVAISVISLCLVLLSSLLTFIAANVIKADFIVANQLSEVLYILILVLGLDLVIKLVAIIYTSDQKAAVLPTITGINSLLVLLVVFLLDKYSFELEGGKLITYVYFISPVPLVTSVIVTVVAFTGRYRRLLPTCRFINIGLIRQILDLGWKFFAIQLSMLFLFQLTNLMVSTWSTPVEVTYLNIADKYFGLISVIGAVVLFPFWSKFTEANEKGEHLWIQQTLRKFELLFLLIAFGALVLLIAFPYIQEFWLGEDINVPYYYTVLVLLKYLFILLNSIYSYYLNGIGRLRLQLTLYLVFASFNIPISYGLFLLYGVEGVLIYVPAAMAIMSLAQKLYVKSILTAKLLEVGK